MSSRRAGTGELTAYPQIMDAVNLINTAVAVALAHGVGRSQAFLQRIRPPNSTAKK